MALESVHPKYVQMLPDWEKIRDVYRGERHVKEQTVKYLPATKGMRLDGFGLASSSTTINIGQEAYDSYLLRACMPDYVEAAVEVFIGLLHSNPPVIELPSVMEPMRDKATQLGESLEMLLRRVNEEQLVTGRLGLLLDLPKNPDPSNPLPYIALYIAEAGRNWDDGELEDSQAKLNMVVLDESGYKRTGFEWALVSKYRVLDMPPVLDENGEIVGYGAYRQGTFVSDGGGTPTYVDSDMAEPMIRGKTLDEIPFIFVNTKDIVSVPDKAPLLSLAELCLTIFRGEADYRQCLFMQGQDTLVIKGDIKRSSDPNELAASDDSNPLRTGTGSVIHLEGGSDNGAEYIGVSSLGLPEMRTALENDRSRAEGKSVALAADSADSNASGEALKTRVGARTASLNQIAKTGAAALEWILKLAATWLGASADAVKVTPNLEFADFQLDGPTLAAIVAAKVAGAPLSWESIHALMVKGNLTEMDYKTEKPLVESEKEDMVPPGTTAGGDPNVPPAQQPKPKPGNKPAK